MTAQILLALMSAACGVVLTCWAGGPQRKPGDETVTPFPDPVPPPEGAVDAPETDSEPRERIADDGRPEWWFPEVREEADALMFCVEVIGTGSLRNASREAVEVAVRRAEIEFSRRGWVFDRDAMRVVKSWGWPLPEVMGHEKSYAGYALVSAETPDTAMPQNG